MVCRKELRSYVRSTVAKIALWNDSLAPSDFHPFSNLEGRIFGKHFEDDNELKTATRRVVIGTRQTYFV